MISLICGIFKNGTNKLIYKTEIESQMQKTQLWLWEVGTGWKDTLGDWNQHIHTAIYKIDG